MFSEPTTMLNGVGGNGVEEATFMEVWVLDVTFVAIVVVKAALAKSVLVPYPNSCKN